MRGRKTVPGGKRKKLAKILAKVLIFSLAPLTDLRHAFSGARYYGRTVAEAPLLLYAFVVAPTTGSEVSGEPQEGDRQPSLAISRVPRGEGRRQKGTSVLLRHM